MAARRAGLLLLVRRAGLSPRVWRRVRERFPEIVGNGSEIFPDDDASVLNAGMRRDSQKRLEGKANIRSLNRPHAVGNDI